MVLLILTLLTMVTINIQAASNKDGIENKHIDIIDTNEPTFCTGTIFGEVGNSHGLWTWETYPFALVTTEDRRTRCNFHGQFKLSFLTLNCEYNVTAYFLGYELTKSVILTKEEPVKEIHFEDDNLTLKRNHIENICKLILKRGLKINWAAPNGVRADTLDEDLLKLMIVPEL